MFTQPSSGVLAREFHPKIGALPLRGEDMPGSSLVEKTKSTLGNEYNFVNVQSCDSVNLVRRQSNFAPQLLYRHDCGQDSGGTA